MAVVTHASTRAAPPPHIRNAAVACDEPVPPPPRTATALRPCAALRISRTRRARIPTTAYCSNSSTTVARASPFTPLAVRPTYASATASTDSHSQACTYVRWPLPHPGVRKTPRPAESACSTTARTSSQATSRLANGENPKKLGQSSTVLTLDTYGHVLPEMQQASAVHLKTLLFEPAMLQKWCEDAAAQKLARGTHHGRWPIAGRARARSASNRG